MAVKGAAPRGGLLDLLLVLMVLGAAWTRTPLGGLGAWAWAAANGQPTEQISLLAAFVTGPGASVVVEVLDRVEIPEIAQEGVGFPEPYRTAAAAVIGAEALPALDADYAGDAEAALERHVIGAEVRARAVERARAAGEKKPGAYAAHRRYLSAADARKADASVLRVMALGRVLGLRWPLDAPHRLTSPYGERLHPVLGIRKFHNGVDLAVPVGTPVFAAQAGRVEKAGNDGVNGLHVVLDHGDGVRTSYCHLSELGVQKGQTLERGASIGLSGNTGRSTGPHLHFTLRIGSGTVDPAPFRPPES